MRSQVGNTFCVIILYPGRGVPSERQTLSEGSPSRGQEKDCQLDKGASKVSTGLIFHIQSCGACFGMSAETV